MTQWQVGDRVRVKEAFRDLFKDRWRRNVTEKRAATITHILTDTYVRIAWDVGATKNPEHFRCSLKTKYLERLTE